MSVRTSVQLRLLLWLKAKLVWRHLARNKAAAVGAVVALLFLVPSAIGVALACGSGFHVLAPFNAEHLLRAVFLGAYLMWLLSPLFGFALTEDYDVSKLLVYPITPRTVFAGALLGSVLDLGVILLIPTLLAVLVSFATNLAAVPVILVAEVLLLAHAVSLSQIIRLAAARVMRSRRARDLAILLVPLALGSIYAGTQLLPRVALEVDWQRFLSGRTWQVVSLLPPGLAARAIGTASRGALGPPLAYCAALGVVSAGTLYAAGWLVDSLYRGEVAHAPVGGRSSLKPQPHAPARSAGGDTGADAFFGLRLPPVVAAVADKEVKYLLRDPGVKSLFAWTIYMFIFFLVALLQGRLSEAGQAVSEPVLWGLAGLLLMGESQLALNIFGFEGASSSTLFLFPSRRRDIFMGKNLVHFLGMCALNAFLLMLLAAAAGAGHLVPQLVALMILGSAVVVACGNVTSVFLPVKMKLDRWGMRRQSSSEGLAYMLLYLLTTIVIGALLLPAIAAILVPAIWVGSVWLVLTVPLGTAYCALLYLASLRLAEKALLAREPDVTAKLTGERDT